MPGSLPGVLAESQLPDFTIAVCNDRPVILL